MAGTGQSPGYPADSGYNAPGNIARRRCGHRAPAETDEHANHTGGTATNKSGRTAARLLCARLRLSPATTGKAATILSAILFTIGKQAVRRPGKAQRTRLARIDGYAALYPACGFNKH